MPGPPGEMQHMWENEIEPRLQRSDSVIRSRTLKLFNISESLVDSLLKPVTPSSNPTVAVYAKQDGIHVRITAKAANDAGALEANIEVAGSCSVCDERLFRHRRQGADTGRFALLVALRGSLRCGPFSQCVQLRLRVTGLVGQMRHGSA